MIDFKYIRICLRSWVPGVSMQSQKRDDQPMHLKISFLRLFLLLSFLASGMAVSAAKPGAPSFLRVDYTINPMGITNQKPVFSWLMQDADRGEKQIAYEIIIASTVEKINKNTGDIWATGWVNSDQQNGIVYNGVPLSSKTTYFWKSRVKDKDENMSPFGSTATFETGLFNNDWTAKWIYVEDNLQKPFFNPKTVNYKDSTVHPLYDSRNWEGDTWQKLVTGKLLRKEFQLPSKTIKQARVYIANLGYYEFRINGIRVGDHVLDPGMTDCTKRVLSVTYDVKDLLQNGSNAVGVMLSNGRLINSKDGFRFQLEIEYEDNQKINVLSDESWKGTCDAPFKSVINWGISKELFDAAKEQTGWDKKGFNDVGWKSVKVNNLDLKIDAQLEAIRVIEVIKPVRTIKLSDSVYRYDMGQNFSGWARMKVNGPKGKIIKIQYSDTQESLMDFNQEDQYTLKGGGVETFEPRFTYHGFQWITLIGYPGIPAIESIQGCVVHTDLTKTGTFSCSNKMLTQLYQNSQWSLRTNVHSVYTDCPSREKVPWLGQWSQETLSQNFDMGKFFLKWKDDIIAAQDSDGRISDKVPGRIHYGWNGTDPVWVSEVVLGTYDIYRAIGDKKQLSDSYPVLQKLIGYYQSIADSNKMISQSRWGDHIGLDKPSPAYLSSAYFFQMVKTMTLIATELNKKEDVATYKSLAESIRRNINRIYFHENGYDNNSQGANAVALHFGIVPEDLIPAVMKSLEQDIVRKGYHVSTGGATTYNLMNALWKYNKTSLGYEMASQDSYPGWGFWLKNGATTSWEQWDVNNASKNHGWLGSYLSSWMVKAIGGISILEPGYHKIKIIPGIAGELSFAKTSIETIKGKVAFSWSKQSPGKLEMVVTIPPNSTAEVYIPSKNILSIREGTVSIWENGKPTGKAAAVGWKGRQENYTIWDIGSGTYKFQITDKL